MINSPKIYNRRDTGIWELLTSPIVNPVRQLNRLSEAMPTTPMVLILDSDNIHYDELTVIENTTESAHHDFYIDEFVKWHNVTESTLRSVMKRLYRDDKSLYLDSADEPNATMLAESTADFIDHPEYCDDESHIIWDIAHEIAEQG